MYFPVDYSIESYDADKGYVIARIWGDNKDWMHELTFKIVKEKGKLYFYPAKHSTMMYIHPWFSVRTDVDDDFNKNDDKKNDDGRKNDKKDKN